MAQFDFCVHWRPKALSAGLLVEVGSSEADRIQLDSRMAPWLQDCFADEDTTERTGKRERS